MSVHKIINDPVFGFIKIPRGPLLDIVKHPLFQRLSRIKQLGLASVVYPGAQHTRFQHSLGAYHLMTEAIFSLSQKGIFIFESEAEAVEAAILMHDIGHGPFSHVLENTLISGISHEEISLMMMEQINADLKGALTLAIKIFQGDYPKRFLHQLLSSQLDVDRLDFTGVTEGNIGSARIIKMLNVKDDELVVDSKGIYSIENYLTSRRLMYWQVYLHKTTVAMEKVLVNALLRAKYLSQAGEELFASPSLQYFLRHDVDRDYFLGHEEALLYYERLDDNDIWCAVKEWSHHSDPVLRMLAGDLVDRTPFRVEIQEEPFEEAYISDIQARMEAATGIHGDDLRYLYSLNTIQKDMYDVTDDHISILYKDGCTKDIAEASEILNVALLSKKIRKYYLCYQRF